MIDNIDNIISLTEFKRNAADVVKRLKEEKSSAVLTVNGAAAVVIMDAKSYQKMFQNAQMGSLVRGIKAGLENKAKGTSIPLEKAFTMLKNDIKVATYRQG